MSIEKYLTNGEYVEFEKGLQIRMGEVNGIEYIRAPGGKITGIAPPDEFAIPLLIEGRGARRRFELKKTKSQPQPSQDWNQYRVTYLGIEPTERGYKVKVKLETIVRQKIALGVVSNTMRSGDELQGPGDLLIRHEGYVNSHMTNTSGESSGDASCMILLKEGIETKKFSVPAPLKESLAIEWNDWVFTFSKTDPNGGTMDHEAPIEFTITKK